MREFAPVASKRIERRSGADRPGAMPFASVRRRRKSDCMHRVVTALVVSALTFVANTAHAQESGRIGLSMGYPERVDLLWHATEHIAIRPGVSWHHTSR